MCGTGPWRTATSLPDVLEPFADAQPEDRSWPAPVYDESGALPTNPRKVVKLPPGSSWSTITRSSALSCRTSAA